MPEAEAVMSLQYRGAAVEAGTMDVRSVAPALIGAADAVRGAHTLLGMPGPPPRVEIRAARPGSFVIDLLVAEVVYRDTVGLFTSPPVDALGGLTVVVSAVLATMHTVRRTKNHPISGQQPVAGSPEETQITLENGEILIVTSSSLILAADADFRRALHRMVEPLAGDSGIDRLTVEAGSESETVTIPDLPAFEVTPPQVQDLGDSFSEVVLQPLSVSFAEKTKWRFTDGDITFFASIEDPNFTALIDQGIERFAKNDTLRVILRMRQTQDTSGVLHTERAVTEVKAHIRGRDPAPGAVQLDIFSALEDGEQESP
jgi:hypothetical protein